MKTPSVTIATILYFPQQSQSERVQESEDEQRPQTVLAASTIAMLDRVNQPLQDLDSSGGSIYSDGAGIGLGCLIDRSGARLNQ